MNSCLPEAQVLSACQILFGEAVKLDRNFLFYLQPSGLKAAFRRRAKEVHPDLLERGGAEARRRRSELFRQLVEAQELLQEFFRQRDAGLWRPGSRPVAAAKPGPARGGDGYFHGQVPQIHLSIGRYCYYRGLIPYRTLIEALSWQRQQRPLLGELARNWGWLSEDGIRRISSSSQPQQRFGERAVALGLLAPQQVQTLLHHQRGRQQRLGHFFVERGYATHSEMEQLVAELQNHNAQVFNRAAAQGSARW